MSCDPTGERVSIILDPELGDGWDPFDERSLQEKYRDRKNYIASLLLANELGDNTLLTDGAYIGSFSEPVQTEYGAKAAVYLASRGFEDPKLRVVHAIPEEMPQTEESQEFQAGMA